MLYKNTASGKMAALEQVKIDITEFISRLNYIQSINEELGMGLLKSYNALCMRVNGAYGPQQSLFDAEKYRLANAYREFWKRIDAAKISG